MSPGKTDTATRDMIFSCLLLFKTRPRITTHWTVTLGVCWTGLQCNYMVTYQFFHGTDVSLHDRDMCGYNHDGMSNGKSVNSWTVRSLTFQPKQHPFNITRISLCTEVFRQNSRGSSYAIPSKTYKIPGVNTSVMFVSVSRHCYKPSLHTC